MRNSPEGSRSLSLTGDWTKDSQIIKIHIFPDKRVVLEKQDRESFIEGCIKGLVGHEKV